MMNKDPKINIFVATHKDFQLPITQRNATQNNIYFPVQVGTGETINPRFLRENQLDNIAEKNPNFCEITVLYFIWKNISTDIVGLAHYRRYFVGLHIQAELYPPQNSSLEKKHKLLTKEQITTTLLKKDIIIPRREQYQSTIKAHYAEHHKSKDWDKVREIIDLLHPDYSQSFRKYENENILYSCNMFIGKKEIIDQYCEWLFPILFKAEQEIDISTYEQYQKRIFGFLAERLFTIWLRHQIEYHQLAVAEFPIGKINI